MKKLLLVLRKQQTCTRWQKIGKKQEVPTKDLQVSLVSLTSINTRRVQHEG